MVTVSIDWSISCPSICIHTGSEWSLKNCVFHFQCDIKKYITVSPTIFNGYFPKQYSCQDERWDVNAQWAIDHIPEKSSIFIEGYSFGSVSGLCYNIAESCGILKNKLHLRGDKYTLVPPTTAKKFAGKGNATKLMMYEWFLKDTGFDLLGYLGSKNPNSSPISDIVDSYWICKFGFSS